MYLVLYIIHRLYNAMTSRLLKPTFYFYILYPPLPWQWLWNNSFPGRSYRGLVPYDLIDDYYMIVVTYSNGLWIVHTSNDYLQSSCLMRLNSKFQNALNMFLKVFPSWCHPIWLKSWLPLDCSHIWGTNMTNKRHVWLPSHA
jgi:hypothetical protein